MTCQRLSIVLGVATNVRMKLWNPSLAGKTGATVNPNLTRCCRECQAIHAHNHLTGLHMLDRPMPALQFFHHQASVGVSRYLGRRDTQRSQDRDRLTEA